MSASQWGWLLLLSVLWGGSFYFVGVAVHTLPTLTLVFIRVGLAAVLLVAVVVIAGKKMPIQPAAWMPFAVMALLNNILPFSLITLGQSQIASGLASVLNATTPLWGVVIAHVMTDDEKITSNRLAGVLIGLGGVAILMGPAAMAGQTSTLFGMVCVTLGAAAYGFARQWGRRLRDTPPLVTAACQLICSSVILLPLVLVIDRPWELPIPPPHVIFALVGLAALSTALAYIVFFHILAVSGGTNVMLVTLLIPVVGILLGALLLDETLLAQHLLGALVIAAALLIFDGRLPRMVRGWLARQPA